MMINTKNKQVSFAEVENYLVNGCGFLKFKSVEGKTNVNHIVSKREKGIYVLYFKDGSYYAGQSKDVEMRFRQHVSDKRSIAKFTFRKVRENHLTITERIIIKILENMGADLTNTLETTSTEQVGVGHGVISSEDIVKWEKSDTWNDLSGNIPKAKKSHSDIEDKYRSKFVYRPDQQEIIDFYVEYIKKCIIKPFKTAPDKWNITCLPTTRYSHGKAISLLNVGRQFAVLIEDDNKSVEITIAVKKSAFRKAHSYGLEQLKKLAPSVREEISGLKILGDDQIQIVFLLSEAKDILKDKGLVHAIRTLLIHKNGMGISGGSPWRGNHCYSFANDILKKIKK